MSSRFDAIIALARNFASASNATSYPHDVPLAAGSGRPHEVFLHGEAHRTQAFDETGVGAGGPHAQHATRAKPLPDAPEPVTLIQPGVARLRQRARPVVDV